MQIVHVIPDLVHGNVDGIQRVCNSLRTFDAAISRFKVTRHAFFMDGVRVHFAVAVLGRKIGECPHPAVAFIQDELLVRRDGIITAHEVDRDA